MICLCSKFLKFIIFTDNTTIFFSDKRVHYCFEIFNNELNKIINLSEWFKANKLSLNLKKGYIVYGRGKRYSKNVLTIDDTVITRLVSTKFVGVIISEDLTWKEHTNVLSNKVSKSIGVLNKIRYILHVSVLSKLCCILILPYYQYCNIRASDYPTDLHKLYMLQKRAIRITSQVKWRDHTSILFKRNRQLPIFSHYHILLHGALLTYAFDLCTMYLHARIYVYVLMLRYMCACVCICICVCMCVYIYSSKYTEINSFNIFIQQNNYRSTTSAVHLITIYLLCNTYLI